MKAIIKNAVVMFWILAIVFSGVFFANADSYFLGDVNGNGVVTASDALLALQFAVGKISLNEQQKGAADVDGSSEVTASDALTILQEAVGKIKINRPIITDYADYQYNYVEPTGLDGGTVYMISSRAIGDEFGVSHERLRLIVCLQGLVNRGYSTHGVAVALSRDSTDDFWWNYISQDGRTYADLYKLQITSFEEFLDFFAPFLQDYGIVLWDPAVPSTANVASTICGLENCVPVMYDTSEGSIYNILTEDYGVEVKMNLVGMFENAKLGGKIADTDLDSTGSSKCDAYIWAMENYMEKCNPEIYAYTLDGATSIDDHPVTIASRNGANDVSRADFCGIPNHDYFISKQCFFFDLTSFGEEAPIDDPTQPIGTDAETLKKIYQKHYDMTGGMYGIVIGFPPWHLKYTSKQDSSKYLLDPPRLEWHFVELSTTYNLGIEADAAHPCWMSNGSLYTNYEMVNTPKGNAEPKDVEYDPDTYYYTIVHPGDFDCSPWMKFRVPEVWRDSNRGDVAMSYSYNANLSDRIPMAFDYIFENQLDNEYIVSHSGVGYNIPNAFFTGFEGKEANPSDTSGTLYKGTTYGSVVKRTLPDGDQKYIEYAKPYYEKLKIDVLSFTLCGFNQINADSLRMFNEAGLRAVFLQTTTAGKEQIRRYKDTMFLRDYGLSGNTIDDRVMNLRSTMRTADYKFIPLIFNNIGTNYGTATEAEKFVNAFSEFVSWRDPDDKYEFVDVNTFIELVRKSGVGVDYTGE